MATKTPSEERILPFLLAAYIPSGASLVSATGFASRKIAGISTTLAANMSIEDGTASLAASPGVGALLTIDPGATEEKFKVVGISGLGPFTCTLSHTAEFAHSSGAVVNYEPGQSSRFLVSTAATIVGSQALLNCRFGADGQTYRVSVIGVLDNGEEVELEQDVVVSELAPTETETIQVDEIKDISFDFAAPVAIANSALQSAIAWVSREETLSTTLANSVSIGDATIELTGHPGVGALLTLNPTGSNQETLKVSAVAGGGPYVATVNPTPDFAHTNGETVNYEPGTTTRLLVSPTASILGTQAIFRKRRGVAGRTYRMTVLATLVNGEKVQHAGHVAIVER